MHPIRHTPLQKLIALEVEASNFGLVWKNHAVLEQQMISECQEVLEAIKAKQGSARVKEELGDVLHTAISWCLFAGYDVEKVLEEVYNKFESRMKTLKKLTQAHRWKDLHGKSETEVAQLWEEVKKLEKR